MIFTRYTEQNSTKIIISVIMTIAIRGYHIVCITFISLLDMTKKLDMITSEIANL